MIGVERCGGGKWADIKKLGFPIIAQRSAVDLKDKWRNLMRVALLPGTAAKCARTPSNPTLNYTHPAQPKQGRLSNDCSIREFACAAERIAPMYVLSSEMQIQTPASEHARRVLGHNLDLGQDLLLIRSMYLIEMNILWVECVLHAAWR